MSGRATLSPDTRVSASPASPGRVSVIVCARLERSLVIKVFRRSCVLRVPTLQIGSATSGVVFIRIVARVRTLSPFPTLVPGFGTEIFVGPTGRVEKASEPCKHSQRS
ncbi:hypothetical protein L596_017041 [Steinernema carpocapsae]|uniref:Uncharacterized protein n=1 Tax=Steinernema carpocapsae TaxID=34508 RepID=A0A4U5N0B9_STECR|nr:hypothetical protein L596_017041 [Steinernema carpocapsae]